MSQLGAPISIRRSDWLGRGMSLLAVLVLLLGTVTQLAAPAAAADERLFAATGFRVNADEFWDYFLRRGGVGTFGLPVSREFTLLGSKVQIFQRQVMQRRADGSVGLLNILDPGLMPYTKINAATLPPFDPAVAAGSPTPGTPGYDQTVIPFIRERAPDSWQGKPVRFYQTFLATVGLSDAYPAGGGNAALLPLLALEIWGLPTSQPAFDPANPSFVYLRFQRGVMQFDATTGLTQGVLLADYLKAILTGDNLPADLDREARTSPFYKQYHKTAYRGLNRPDALSGTDLTAAFEPEGTPTRVSASPTAGPSATPNATVEATSIANDKLQISIGIGGADHGKLTVRSADNTTRLWSVPAIGVKNGGRLSLKDDSFSDGATARVVALSDPILGEGKQLEAEFPLKNGGKANLRAALFSGKTYFTYQLGVRGLPPDRLATSFRLVDGEGFGWIDVTGAATLLSDEQDLRKEALRAERTLGEVQAGKPLLLNDVERNRAFVLATLDASDHYVAYQARPASGEGIRFFYETVLSAGDQAIDATSPRVLVDLVPAGDQNVVLSGYRRAINSIYPTPKLPDWVRYQWSAAEALGNDLNEANIRRQIDYISSNLADLGPWQVVIESGWLRADDGGRAVDRDRFPSGMRALVDYAHARGVRVTLGVPGPLVEASAGGTLRFTAKPLVERNRDWLITLGDGGRFLFDFRNAGFRAWWSDLVRDVLVGYDADGIRIDGFGDAVSAVVKLNPRPSLQSAELYRLTAEQAWAVKPNAFIEANWYVPPFANPYVHVVRAGDETLAFDRPAPRAGLRQHLDYALYQRIALNQRPHLGDVLSGDGDAVALGYRWIEAGLAVGGLSGLATNLAAMDEAALMQLRHRLVHQRPFEGKTSFSFGISAEAVATEVDGLTYLGFVNRGASRKSISAKLTDFGLQQRPSIVRDVSSGAVFLTDESITTDMPAGSFKLFIVRQDAGWIWSSSSVAGTVSPGVLRYQLRGPTSVAGTLEVAVPTPTRVLLDGQLLPTSGYTYDPAIGILRLTYGHDQPHEVRVEYTSNALLPQRNR
ncbi:MAG: hypothetical protein U0556_09585 [Dehalococcoidia bacterium]